VVVATGDVVSFSWTPTEFGTYTISLNVTDELGFWDLQIDVVDFVDDPPNASIGASLSSTAPLNYTPTISAYEGDKINFWSLSTDPQDNIVSWLWDFDDGDANSTFPITNYTYDDAGTYIVTLTVEDASGNTDSVNMTVKIKEEEDDRREVITSLFLGPILIGLVVAIIVAYIAYRQWPGDFEWPGANIIALVFVVIALFVLIDQFVYDLSFAITG
jgi:hypothetical protein